MSIAAELFAIDRAYVDNGSGGMPEGQSNSQRATWANDRRMAGTPFSAMTAPPKGPNRSKSLPPGLAGATGSCTSCGGNDGHRPAQCPSHVAKKDTAFRKKTQAQQDRGCRLCGGTGHFDKHHSTTARAFAVGDDGGGGGRKGDGKGSKECYDFKAGKCHRGKDCRFAHVGNPGKPSGGGGGGGKPAGGGRTTTDAGDFNSPCNAWAKWGQCLR